jgi:hypothetical protein
MSAAWIHLASGDARPILQNILRVSEHPKACIQAGLSVYPRQRQEGGRALWMGRVGDEMSRASPKVERQASGRPVETDCAPGWLGPAGWGRKSKFLSVTRRQNNLIAGNKSGEKSAKSPDFVESDLGHDREIAGAELLHDLKERSFRTADDFSERFGICKRTLFRARQVHKEFAKDRTLYTFHLPAPASRGRKGALDGAGGG